MVQRINDPPPLFEIEATFRKWWGMKKRLVVGLTGSFGSGKTTASKMLKELGARKIINADKIAHEAFKQNKCLQKIKSLFGTVNRKQIAREVFSSLAKRKALEKVIHPYVRKRIMAESKKVKSGIIILEVPLLFESKFDRMCDVTVVVLAGRSNIIKRLSRRGFNQSEISSRLKVQLSESEKMKKADFIIDNKKSKESLKKNTRSVWQKVLSQCN